MSFDQRFRALFNDIIRGQNRPLGEVVDFFTQVDFQHRDSPHIHGLLWIKEAQEYDSTKPDTLQQVVTFVDKHVTCQVLL